MNLLSTHWEKIVLGIVCVLFVAVGALAFLGKTAIEEFTESKKTTTVQGADVSSGIPGLAELAAKPSPTTLTPDSFSHPWLQRSTADPKAVIPKYAKICVETGIEVMYKEDADGDGMPNKWEDKWGFNWINPSDGTMDKDGDSFTNVEEFKLETDPTNPADPNVIDEEYRVKEVYRPKRPIKLRGATLRDNKATLQLEIKTDNRTKTPFQTTGDTIKIDNKDRYLLGEFQEVITNIFNKALNRPLEKNISQVTVTDILTGKDFVLVINQDSFELYIEAKIVRKDTGDELVLKQGDELPVAKLKKNAKASRFDEKDKTVTFTVGTLEYTVKTEN